MFGYNWAARALQQGADQLVGGLNEKWAPAMADVLWTSAGKLREAANVTQDLDITSVHAIAATAAPTSGPLRGQSDDFGWFDPARSPAERVNSEINECLAAVNPGFDPYDPRWSNNCAAVATAYELRRRGLDVQAGPTPSAVRSGLPHLVTEMAWGRGFTTVMRREHLFEAFREPGSRGIVIADWPPGYRIDDGDSHLFNVEHVPDVGLRFVDGQPNPPLNDAGTHVQRAAALRYLRVDDLADPPPDVVADLGIYTPVQHNAGQ